MAADENTLKDVTSGEENSWQKSILLYLHDLVYMLAAIMLVFLLLFRMVIVSGSSMYETLHDGDWLLLISNVFYQEPEYGDIIRKAFEIRKPAKLSQPALEVLTIIAYYQPTTRAYVDQIRGVDSSYTVGLLLERKLIEECGRLQVPGRPHLYRTTKAFLRAFHLNSLEDLPEMPGLEADGQLRLDEDGGLLGGSAGE